MTGITLVITGPPPLLLVDIVGLTAPVSPPPPRFMLLSGLILAISSSVSSLE